MDSKTSPLPWSQRGDSEIIDAEGAHVCFVAGDSTEQRDANMALIIASSRLMVGDAEIVEED